MPALYPLVWARHKESFPTALLILGTERSEVDIALHAFPRQDHPGLGMTWRARERRLLQAEHLYAPSPTKVYTVDIFQKFPLVMNI